MKKKNADMPDIFYVTGDCFEEYDVCNRSQKYGIIQHGKYSGQKNIIFFPLTCKSDSIHTTRHFVLCTFIMHVENILFTIDMQIYRANHFFNWKHMTIFYKIAYAYVSKTWKYF